MSTPNHTTFRRGAATLCMAITLGAALPGAGCFVEYDFERQVSARGTLGEELHAIWRKDTARSPEDADAKVALLDTRRDDFVRAVDRAAPASDLQGINVFLQGALELANDGTLPELTRKLEVILQRGAEDQALLDALSDATAPGPEDFVSPAAVPNFMGYVTAYPKLRELGLEGTQIVLDNDGFLDTGGYDTSEPDGVSQLTRTVAAILEDAEADALEEPIAILVRDVLLREDERFATAGVSNPIYVGVYDRRGMPRVDSGVLREGLFVDLDGDGLADLDAQGRFVATNGQNIDPRAFAADDDAFTRDAFGRAILNEKLAFEYVDLNKTGLSFLVGEFAELSQKDVTTNLLTAFRPIMGQTVVQSDDRGDYLGFSADHPLMDFTYGGLHLLAHDGLPELLADSAGFLDEGAGDLAGVLVALERAFDISEGHPGAALNDNSSILYDLIPVLHEIAQDEALWADFMLALGDPVTPRVGDAMVTLMSYRNTRADVALGGAYDACFAQCRDTIRIGTNERFECITSCPNSEIFKEPMDFSAPEGPQTRSMLQGTWHLMWSLTGVPYEMQTTEVTILGNTQPQLPPLIRLPGGAEAFLASVAGNLRIADAVPPEVFSGDELGPLLTYFNISSDNIAGIVSLLSQLFGVQLGVEPTPDQLTRLFNQQDIAFRDGDTVIDIAEPVDKDGFKIAENLADGLFEAEASGLVDAVYPVAKAFSDHGREDLLLALFAVVHDHYSSAPGLYRNAAGGDSPSRGANLRSYEPIMKEVFADGTLLRALYNLSVRLDRLERSKGIAMAERARVLILHATRADGFTRRDGQAFITMPDGRTISNLSRMHVTAEAAGAMLDRIESEPEARDLFTQALGDVLDVVLAAQWPDDGEASFVKPGGVALTSNAARYLADRAAQRRDAGELTTWMTQDVLEGVRDFWQSRLLVGLVSVAEDVLGVEENRALLGDFNDYLVGTQRGRENTAMMLYGVVVRSVNTDAWVPIAKALARALDPDRDWGEEVGDRRRMGLISHGALVLRETVRRDEAGAGLTLINRGFTADLDGELPFAVIADVVGDYWRADPTSTASYSAQDWRLFMTRVAAWIGDDAHGMEQIYDLAALK